MEYTNERKIHDGQAPQEGPVRRRTPDAFIIPQTVAVKAFTTPAIRRQERQ